MSNKRIDLELITSLVDRETRVLDIGCGNGELLDSLKRKRKVIGQGLELKQERVNQCVARGLSAIQGDADKDLGLYPNQSFDCVILSQTIQATGHPKLILTELIRIGKKSIVSIPNFGYWKVRLHLLFKGTMPVTKNLPNEWYNTPNLHMCTIKDFVNFCKTKNIKIDKSMCLTNEKISEITNKNMSYKNIFSQLGILLIE